MLQMKLLQQFPDLLTAPLSGFEISIAFIIGGAVRGMVNGVLVLLLGMGFYRHASERPTRNYHIYIFSIMGIFKMGLLLGQLAESWDQLAMMQNFFLTH
ncbi:hypothetical protein Ct9H90mP29_06950 [bacterium]|nr:MAG: hypothetical protein Ct9H90mP29_06950 [bacterium]